MIVNSQNKFIFVHVFRTGGSSIEKTLGGNTRGFNTHTKLEEVPNWRQYFSFGFVRNPWDRMVSGYMYLTTRNQFKGSWDQYVGQFTKGRLRTAKQFAQHDMLKNCSFVGRFEHLQEDFDTICELAGITQRKLPHVWKTKHKPYIDYYTDEQKKIVEDAYSGDIGVYGFTFDSTATKNIGKDRDHT